MIWFLLLVIAGLGVCLVAVLEETTAIRVELDAARRQLNLVEDVTAWIDELVGG